MPTPDDQSAVPLPTVATSIGATSIVATSIVAVVPAAGHSRRMQQHKLLLPLHAGGQTQIAAVIRLLCDELGLPTVVTVRKSDELLTAAVRETSAILCSAEVDPPDMRASVQLAIDLLTPPEMGPKTGRRINGWLLLPADSVGLDRAAFDRVLNRWRELRAADKRPDIVVATHLGQRGHPAVFSMKCAQRLRSLPTDCGVNALFNELDLVIETVEIPAPEVLADLNSPDDVARWFPDARLGCVHRSDISKTGTAGNRDMASPVENTSADSLPSKPTRETPMGPAPVSIGTFKQEFAETACRELSDALQTVMHVCHQLTADEVWRRSVHGLNSPGNILLHLTGNLRQWVVCGLTETPDTRNRPAEFGADAGDSLANLLTNLQRCVAEACAAMRSQARDTWCRRRRIQGFDVTGLEAVWHSVSHFRGHTQELIFMVRQLRGAEYRFRWTPTTAEQGAAV